MKARTIALMGLMLASSAALAGAAEIDAMTKAQAQCATAQKAVLAAEAAVVPVKSAMQIADAAYATAQKDADAKRQQATEAKRLAGEEGVKELQQAVANVPAASTALADAINAKPALDKALADARAAALPLQQAYEAAAKATREAEVLAKTAADAANKLDGDAQRATAQAAAKRRAADAARAILTRARQGVQSMQDQVNALAQQRTEAQMQQKTADEAMASATRQVAAATTAYQSAAQAADAMAKAAAACAEGPKAQQKAAAAAAAQRMAADTAQTSLTQARATLQNLQNLAAAAAQKLTRATTQKTPADTALVNFQTQLAAATTAWQAAEQAAQAAAQLAQEKNQAAAQVAAQRRVAAEAVAALAQARQNEQQAQEQALTAAPSQKQAATAALAIARKQVASAKAANQAAQDAGKDILQRDAASQQARTAAREQRQAAVAARAALVPAQQKLEYAAQQASAAGQKVLQAEARKKAAEENLASLTKRIAAAKQSYVTDEQAAKAAEAVAAPLKAQADKTRAAYAAAVQSLDEQRALAEQAKAAIYRLGAGMQVAKIMESGTVPVPANRIDEIVFAKLKTLGIKPILCSDAVFVRRAYLDLTGTLPSAPEAKAFIASSDQNKRGALIDRLLVQPNHVHYWAMKWSDILRIKAEFPVKLWPNAAQAYHRWVWEALARNKPYDQFARELLTSSGSNFRVGPVNFYRAIQDKTPEGIAAVVGLTFMGTRVQLWPESRRAGMAAFFTQVGYKPTSEWKEEVVFWDPLHISAVPGNSAPGVDSIAKAVTTTNQIPQALAQPLPENGPLAAVFPDGTKVTIPPDRDPREVFADWLIRPENPWFTKAVVNRTWAWVMGRGIIQEPDDIRDDNPPGNPELLAYLQKELVSSGYDLRHLQRLIFSSTTYQFSSLPRFPAPEARANFASYQLRRVEAEVLIDALNNITGSSDLYTSAVPEPFTYIPGDMPAVGLADGSITSSFLTLFGRSARATGVEGERVNELASSQWLQLLNSATLQSKLQNGPKLAALLSAGRSPQEITENLYLTILSRFPTETDVKAAAEYARTGVTKGHDAWIDLAWALINSPEFLLRH